MYKVENKKINVFKFASIIFAILTIALKSVECAKILSIFPFPGPSQYLCVQPYLRQLAARGHEITSVTEFPQKKPLKNFRDIIIKADDFPQDELTSKVVEEEPLNRFANLRRLHDLLSSFSVKVMENEEFQKVFKTQHFDLIIIEVLFLETLYALGHHFKAPIIGLSTFGTDVIIDQLVDNITPLSYVPAPNSKYLHGMNYWQRLEHLYYSTLELLYHHLVIIPDHQRLYEKYFPNHTINLSDVRRDFSLLLLNQHYSLSLARPYVPNAIEAAGMHIDYKPSKLPKDMEAFINASANGAIYFSLGSNVKSALLPKKKLQIFMDVFASLPVNVLWKFEKPDLPGQPKNVFISKWFPQPDILAHPNVKIFITHGGMHSYIETVHYAKPIVGVPIFYDQHLNAARAKSKGLGVVVNLRNLTRDDLRSAILEVLNNLKYTEAAQTVSARYHDRPMNGLDTALYWTDHVLRHKGAPHLRVAARHLNFWQRNSVDTMAVLFGIPLLILIFIIVGLCKVLKTLSGGNKSAQNESRNKRKNE